MNFFKFLDKLQSKKKTLIIYSLLDRIPIVVLGNDSNVIDEFLIELSELVHFRKEVVFFTDFISKSEYLYLIQNEDVDYNSQRIQVRCPSNVALKALSQIDNFKSWLIGVVFNTDMDINRVKNLIKEKIKEFLCIIITSNPIFVEMKGINVKLIDLTLEQNILQKIFRDTEKSIAQMKRILTDKIKSNMFDEEFIKTLLDFETEKEELKKNIFKKEIQDFYYGSKRAFFILTKLNLLDNLNIHTKIGGKTLLKSIDYDYFSLDGIISAPIDRMISFINKEWGEDFSNLIENGKKIGVEDKIQSLWG